MRQLSSFTVVLALVVVSGCSDSADEAPVPAAPPGDVFEFGVYWPPQDSADPAGPIGEPFLLGKLYLDDSTNDAITLSVDLTRPHDDEDDREAWNSRLAYREYDWMKRLRVWDADKKWLWPNLPYLLRAHGLARFERYGGVDPGSGEDNDFAAVLIRAYDPEGKSELAVTEDSPLVSAEWSPVGVADVDRKSIVHMARSDPFSLPIDIGVDSRGLFRVWLIYADFMGAPSPSTWPKTREWRGGILAYFEIAWSRADSGEAAAIVEQKTPPSDTGFDWEKWIGTPNGDERDRAVAKLSIR